MECPIHQLLPTLKDYSKALAHQDIKRVSNKKFSLQYHGKQHTTTMKKWIHHAKHLAKKNLNNQEEYRQLLYIVFGLKYSVFEAMKKMKKADAMHASTSLVKLRTLERRLLPQQASFHTQEIYSDLSKIYINQKHKFELLNTYYKELVYRSSKSKEEKLLAKIHTLISEIEGLKMIYKRLFWLTKETPRQALLLLHSIIKTKHPLFEALLQIGFYDTDIGQGESYKRGYLYNKDISTLFFSKVFDRKLLLDAKLKNIQPFI